MKKYLLILIGLIFLLSCNDGSTGTPVETIYWEEDGNGFLQFKTNDSWYYNYTSWKASNVQANPMTSVTAEIKRVSGYENAAYGIIFCFSNSGSGVGYYLFSIVTEGAYQVGKMENNSWIIVKNWTTSVNLNVGYNTINTVKITRTATAAGADFSVQFNGVDEPDPCFQDSSYSGGYYGFMNYISGEDWENFPEISSDAKFKLTLPSQYP